jgi:hypothetical protein
MRTLGLTCLSSTLFVLPVIVTVIVYAGIESQKVLDVLHGKIPLSATVPTVPRPKGPRVIETDTYCNKSYAILPFPGRYMCKSRSPLLQLPSGHPEKEAKTGSDGWLAGWLATGEQVLHPTQWSERRANFGLGDTPISFGRVNKPNGAQWIFTRSFLASGFPWRHAVDDRHTLAGIHCNVSHAPKLTDDRKQQRPKGPPGTLCEIWPPGPADGLRRGKS